MQHWNLYKFYGCFPSVSGLFPQAGVNNSNRQKPSSKSLDQAVMAEVAEHNKTGRYPSDVLPDGYLSPPIRSLENDVREPISIYPWF